MNLLKLCVWAIIIYFGIAAYGSAKEFEVALNASETITPLMLKESFEATHAYLLFLALLFFLNGRM